MNTIFTLAVIAGMLGGSSEPTATAHQGSAIVESADAGEMAPRLDEVLALDSADAFDSVDHTQVEAGEPAAIGDTSTPSANGGGGTIWFLLGLLPLALPFLGTALSADRVTEYKDWGMVLKSYPVNASEVIYKGSLVVIDTDGYARAGVDTASYRCVGIAAESVTGGSADGDEEIQVISGVLALLPASSLAATDVPNIMYLVDDQTIDETTPANSVKVGRLHEYVSATSGWVHIPVGGTTE